MDLVEDEKLGLIDERVVLVASVRVNKFEVYRVRIREEDIDTLVEDFVLRQPEEVQRDIIDALFLFGLEFVSLTGVSDVDTLPAVLAFFECVVIARTFEVLEGRIQVPFCARGHVTRRISVVNSDRDAVVRREFRVYPVEILNQTLQLVLSERFRRICEDCLYVVRVALVDFPLVRIQDVVQDGNKPRLSLSSAGRSSDDRVLAVENRIDTPFLKVVEPPEPDVLKG
ncbi:hypothetical protein C465_02036 [Halorubrum distributum JCM 9100]|uniref:Uncharacterized protein n=2 Tax=Halorubrum distributum TaxID=29283 RepID=M0EX25_9EURY|nr:hypothetical protein C465_02036 [Halorubrum distributum JCM 9100]ELZ58881.1 hypothetical protein C466_00370 [Halorubrum distributum JCM 10118]